MKTIFITGADRGLGFSLVKENLNRGYYVLAGKYFEASDQLKELAAKTSNLTLIPIDISMLSSVRAAKDEIQKYVDHLDILLNCSGILGDTQKKICDEIDFDDALHTINVNALGTLRVMNELFPLVIAGYDKLIVNISSEAGQVCQKARDSWFGYCMSKAALNSCAALTHNYLKTLGGSVMQIHPGYVKTYMLGTLNEEATYTADYAAEQVCLQIDDFKKYRGESPAYINLFGERLEW